MLDVEDRLRLLARWHARRREVDELLEPLLAHGPAAVERVSCRLGELTEALAAERLAFEAFAAAAALVEVEAQGPDRTGPVDELAAARLRAEQTRLATAGSIHPSVSDVLRQIDLHVPPAPRRHSEDEEPVDS